MEKNDVMEAIDVITRGDDAEGLANTKAIGRANIYAFNLADLESGWSYFELVETENSIPYHLSFRPDENIIVTNCKIDGEWEVEKRTSFDYGQRSDLKGFLIIDDDGLILEIEGKEILSAPPQHVTLDKMELRASNALTVSLYSSALKVDKDYISIPVDGLNLKFPTSEFDVNTLARMIADCQQTLDASFDFAATRVFPRSADVLVAGSPKLLLAPLCARLYPNSRIVVIDAVEEEQAEIDAAMGANESQAQYLGSEALAEAKLSDEVVLCGRACVESGLVEILSGRATTLHLCTVETEPQPLDKVHIEGGAELGNAMVSIHDKPHWSFRYHARGTLKKRRPGLDIAVAMYNAKDYIIECVESLLTPGRDDVRVIVVDDGSTDGCEKLVEKHFKKDNRVRVETKANGGCASARNYGRLVSDATHITFVDADDFVDEGFYSNLFDLASYSGYEVVQGGFDFYDETLNPSYYNSYEEELFSSHSRFAFGEHPAMQLDSIELIHGQPTIWRRIYRRDFLDAKNIYFPENIRAYDDYVFHLLTLTYARSVIMLPELKYHYRQHPEQDIKKGDERHFYELYMFRLLLKR